MWLKEQHKNETTLNQMNSLIKLKQGEQEFLKIGKLDLDEKSLSPAGFRDGKIVYKDITTKHIIPDQGVNKLAEGDQAKIKAKKQKEKEYEMENKNLNEHKRTINQNNRLAEHEIGSKAYNHHV